MHSPRLKIIASGLMAGLLLLVTACQDPQPISIGFLGPLTGRASGLGTAARNGFLLAIDQANAAGGIKGRQIVGLPTDTNLDQEVALQAVHNLLERQVRMIIGPMSSQVAVTTVPELNQAEIPMISPTVSTNELTGLDDFFFRVYYTNAQAAQLLAERLRTTDGYRRIAVIYDLGNRAYTENWLNIFKDHLVGIGGNLISDIPFEYGSNTLFTKIVTKAIAGQPDALLILANAVDTALICQQLEKQGIQLPRYATGWSYSDDLFQFGGKAVEGLVLIQSADMDVDTAEMDRFRKAYLERYREQPKFQSLHAYDATRIAIDVLSKTEDPQEIRRLLRNQSFQGVQTRISFDQNGDLSTPRLFLARVENGVFQIID